MQTYDKFYINGEWVAPHGTGTIEVIDPSTEEVCGVVPSGDDVDVDAAVAAAKAAFKTWSRSSAAERSEIIGKLADKITENMAKIGELCARELGTPLQASIATHGGLGIGVMSSYKEIPFEMEKEEQIGSDELRREFLARRVVVDQHRYGDSGQHLGVAHALQRAALDPERGDDQAALLADADLLIRVGMKHLAVDEFWLDVGGKGQQSANSKHLRTNPLHLLHLLHLRINPLHLLRRNPKALPRAANRR